MPRSGQEGQGEVRERGGRDPESTNDVRRRRRVRDAVRRSAGQPEEDGGLGLVASDRAGGGAGKVFGDDIESGAGPVPGSSEAGSQQTVEGDREELGSHAQRGADRGRRIMGH